MSPEQVRRQPVDERSDIYSLGVLFYQLLTGRLPFQGTVDRVLKDILDASPTSPHVIRAAVPQQIATVCLKAMVREPDDRHQTAEELGSALNQYVRPAGRTRSKFFLFVLAAFTLVAAATI